MNNYRTPLSCNIDGMYVVIVMLYTYINYVCMYVCMYVRACVRVCMCVCVSCILVEQAINHKSCHLDDINAEHKQHCRRRVSTHGHVLVWQSTLACSYVL